MLLSFFIFGWEVMGGKFLIAVGNCRSRDDIVEKMKGK